MLIAMLVNQKVAGQNIFRTIYYLPSVTAGVAVALLWVWLLNPTFGPDQLRPLSLVGITGAGLAAPTFTGPSRLSCS